MCCFWDPPAWAKPHWRKPCKNIGRSVRNRGRDHINRGRYVGEDVENILLRLIQAADCDIERAERGIIYVDEIEARFHAAAKTPRLPAM